MRTIVMVSLVATLTIAGCGSGYKPPPAPPAQKPQASQTSAKPAAASTAQTPAPQSGAMGAAVMSGGLLAPSDMMNGPEGVAPARSASPPAAPAPTYQKAQVGVGQKGGDYGGGALMKPITTPASVYWRAQERITFDQIKHAMDLYKASNGSAPKTHEEFMEKIIQENNLKLPQLPPGQRYVYLPDKEELMVEQPAQ
ncbi:MAG: hypothetical protein ACLQNE_27235 [Thermoguttaceae bacterium]